MKLSDKLTKAELRVEQYLLEGWSNKEIGVALNVDEKTVKFHVSRIIKKYGQANRARYIVMKYKELLTP